MKGILIAQVTYDGFLKFSHRNRDEEGNSIEKYMEKVRLPGFLFDKQSGGTEARIYVIGGTANLGDHLSLQILRLLLLFSIYFIQ